MVKSIMSLELNKFWKPGRGRSWLGHIENKVISVIFKLLEIKTTNCKSTPLFHKSRSPPMKDEMNTTDIC